MADELESAAGEKGIPEDAADAGTAAKTGKKDEAVMPAMEDEAATAADDGGAEGPAEANDAEDLTEVEPTQVRTSADASADPDGDETAAAVDPTAVRPTAGETLPRPSAQGSDADEGIEDEKPRRFRARRGAVVAAILGVAIIVIAVIAILFVTGVPEEAFVQEDALSRVSAPAYDSGNFGQANTLEATDVQVTTRTRRGSSAEADVLVTFTGDTVYAQKATTLSYVTDSDGTWVASGSESNTQINWVATDGVDQDKVLENISKVLNSAEQTLEADGTETTDLTLVGLYASGSLAITDEEFDEDAQTDTLTISCVRTYDFERYSCQITVTFKFRPGNGAWEITSTEVSDGAKTRSYAPLEVTWSGVLAKTESGGKATCSGADETGLVVTVREAADDGTSLTAKVTATAHYHAYPNADATSCTGDKELSAVETTLTRVDGTDDATGSSLAFTGTISTEDGKVVALTIGFGTEEDASAVVAVVTTTYTYTETLFFIPYDTTVTYTDTFDLV